MTTLVRSDWNELWDTYADSASENPAQSYRRELVFAALELNQATGPVRLLDVGSGQGDFSAEVSRRYPHTQLLGLELSHSGVAISRGKVPGAVFEQRDLTIAQAPQPELRGWATHAVCSEMLEHVDDAQSVLENIAPYLKQGCRLVITLPGGPMSEFDRHIGHRKHYRAAELRQLLEKTGFQVQSVWRAGFPFMNLYRLVVILRGKALIRDVARQPGGAMSGLALTVMRVFSFLFAFNRRQSPWGWQLVAVAKKL